MRSARSTCAEDSHIVDEQRRYRPNGFGADSGEYPACQDAQTGIDANFQQWRAGRCFCRIGREEVFYHTSCGLKWIEVFFQVAQILSDESACFRQPGPKCCFA